MITYCNAKEQELLITYCNAEEQELLITYGYTESWFPAPVYRNRNDSLS